MSAGAAGGERLFVALPLPGAVRRQLEGVRDASEGVAWIASANLHLTMRFLGEVPDDRMSSLEATLARVRVEPFILPVEGAGVFPPRRPPRALWVGTGRSHPRLFQLRQRIDDALLTTGLAVDMRSFHAHITVGRLQGSDSSVAWEWLEAHEGFVAAPFRVDGFGLYRSERAPGGSVYSLRRWFAFEEGGQPPLG